MILALDLKKNDVRHPLGTVSDAEHTRRGRRKLPCVVGTGFHTDKFERGEIASYQGENYLISEIFWVTHDSASVCLMPQLSA